MVHHTSTNLYLHSYQFLSVWHTTANYIHIVVQQIYRTFSPCMTETLYPLSDNSPFLPPHSPWQPPFYFPFPWIWLIYIPRISAIMQYLSFIDWFILLSILSSRRTPDVAYDRISFFFFFHSLLRLKNIPLCACVYKIYEVYFIYNLYLFIHQWRFRLLLHLANCESCYNDHKCAHIYSGSCFQFFMDIYTGNGLLDHIAICF